MTTSTEAAAGPQLNGQAPGPSPDGESGPPPVSTAERLMGVIGIAFAIGLLLIGVDLATGGAVSQVLARITPAGGDGEQRGG